MTQKTSATIAVVGDTVIDHHLYEGERSKPSQFDKRGARLVEAEGGADGLRALMTHLWGEGLIRVEDTVPKSPTRAYAVWKPMPVVRGAEEYVWRAQLLGYGADGGGIKSLAQVAASPPDADVLVIDDADLGYRNRNHSALKIGDKPKWVLLKTTAPVARGALWHSLVADGGGRRLICLVSANDLRRDRSTIGVGLSWDRTVIDLKAAFSTDPDLMNLTKCRHLVVTLSTDGALWIDGPGLETPKVRLICTVAAAEGDWTRNRDGDVAGFQSLVAASLALAAAKSPSGEDLDLDPAINSGLSGMRDLAELGHGRIDDKHDGVEDGIEPEGFPKERCASVLSSQGQGYDDAKKRWKKVDDFITVPVSWNSGSIYEEGWSILESAQVPPGSNALPSLLGLARLVVQKGAKAALRNVPHAVFGKLTVVDRGEIEALRHIRVLMQDYRDNPKPPRPLCIGVFGPPGAGKSFGVKQLANDIFGKDAWLEFNLSQFSNPSELLGPFHQARDLVLEGKTPVVFWDEFDASELKWLQYLIAPMQDGRFQDNQLTHAVGKAVFVFAGGTKHTFGAFSQRPDSEHEQFRLRKGPDFVSRIDAYFDVTGPNPRLDSGPSRDLSYPVRRAFIIRHILAGDSKLEFEIDSDLLTALLLVPTYKHGSRSLEKLTLAIRGQTGGPVRRSGLPAPRDLAMHVDDKSFLAIMNVNAGFRTNDAVNRHAPIIHEAFRDRKRKANETMAPGIDQVFAQLHPAFQEENRTAVRRTADVLALIGMGIVKKGNGVPVSKAEFEAHAEYFIERLAEAEHEGWMAQRLANGWSWGKTKDHDNLKHDGLVPYSKLNPTYQENDRAMIRSFWSRIQSEFVVVWLDRQVDR